MGQCQSDAKSGDKNNSTTYIKSFSEVMEQTFPYVVESELVDSDHSRLKKITYSNGNSVYTSSLTNGEILYYCRNYWRQLKF
jgi:hypothetical protein